MGMNHGDAVELVYIEACRKFREAHVSGNVDDAQVFRVLCEAIEIAYPIRVSIINNTAAQRNGLQK